MSGKIGRVPRRRSRGTYGRLAGHERDTASGCWSVGPRELQIASLVAEGLSNAKIAERMSVEPASLKRSVSRIISRLGLDSRVRVAVAWRTGRR